MKIIKYLYLVVAASFFSQCTDLTEEPYTFLAPSTFYKTGAELNMAVTSVYDGYQSAYGGANYKHHMYLEVLTDFGAPAYAKDDVHLWNAWVDVNNPARTFADNWPRSYVVINRANIVLGRGEGVEMDATLKTRYFAEVRFLRALTYYNLVRIFGGVPVPATYTSSMDGLELPRKTVEETYAQIIADLEFAEANLPLKSTYAAADKWRPGKGAAEAFLGEVYLTRASMEGKAEFYQKSKEYSGKVIASGEYQLEPGSGRSHGPAGRANRTPGQHCRSCAHGGRQPDRPHPDAQHWRLWPGQHGHTGRQPLDSAPCGLQLGLGR